MLTLFKDSHVVCRTPRLITGCFCFILQMMKNIVQHKLHFTFLTKQGILNYVEEVISINTINYMTTVYTVYEMHTHKKLREYAKESQAKLYRDLVWAEKLKGEIRNGVYISVETIGIDEEFNEMAMSAMLDLGLPEDEAELLLEDFNCMAV